ncbi:hypothetical protein [Actinophytocola sp. KF-1]
MRGALFAVVVIAAMLTCTPRAVADPAYFTVDDTTPDLSDNRTVALTVTNLTGEDLDIVVRPRKPAADCGLGAQPDTLPRAQPTTVTITVPETCPVPDTGLRILVIAPPTQVDVIVKAPPAAASTWSVLLVFPAVLLLFAAVATMLWRREMSTRDEDELPYLDAAWSFKDSWAGNVTVIGGLLTGVLGSSDVVKAILGEDSEQSIALATVGAAIAVAFVAAGPVLFLATKRNKIFRISGLFAAATLTVSGAIGELVVVAESARSLDLDGFQTIVWLPCFAAIALLLVYSYRTVHQTVVDGTTAPDPPVDSDVIRAAKLVVAALRPGAQEPQDRLEERAVAITAVTRPLGTRRVSGSI